MDARAASTLTAAGYDGSRHAAQKFDPGSLAGLDLVLAMDGVQPRRHPRDVADLTDADADRVRLFRDFDPDEPGGDVPDPFYGGDAGFEEVLTMVERTAAVIVTELHRSSRDATAGHHRTGDHGAVTRQPLVARRAEELLGCRRGGHGPGRRRRHRHRHPAPAQQRHDRADEDPSARAPRLLRDRGRGPALARRGRRRPQSPRCWRSTTSA